MRDVHAQNEYLRKALALRRKLQEFLRENGALDDPPGETFTLGGADTARITPEQKIILMRIAPEDVKEMNR